MGDSYLPPSALLPAQLSGLPPGVPSVAPRAPCLAREAFLPRTERERKAGSFPFFPVGLDADWELVFACPAPPPFGHCFSSLPRAAGLATPFLHLRDQVGTGPGCDQLRHPVFQGTRLKLVSWPS